MDRLRITHILGGLVLLAGLISTSAPVFAEIKVFSPPDRAVVKEDEIAVEGFFSVGGRFSQTVTLVPGENRMKFVDPKDQAVTAYHLFYDNGEVKIADGYKVYRRHDALDDGCDLCHQTGEGGAWELAGKMPGMCYDCHDDFSRGEPASLHYPVEEGECTECHGVHFAPERRLLKGPGSTVCMECHDDIPVNRKGDEWAFSHDPVAERDCTGCHSPHESGQKKLLMAKVPALCNDCHDDVVHQEDGSGWPHPHDPVAEDDCGSCHQVHGSEARSLLANKMPDLCNDCHDDISHADDGSDWSAPHDPVAEGSCGDCHLIHGSAFGSLLSAEVPALCNDCHDDLAHADDGSDWPFPHDPVAEEGCGDCHQYHGSEARGLLTAKTPDLCNDCHDDVAHTDDGSDWPAPHDPVAEGSCGDCHRIHGSAVASLLSAKVPTLCNDCHDDLAHADDGSEWPFPHDPVAEEGCGDCHQYHGSEARGLLTAKTPDLCNDCHDDVTHVADGSEWPFPHDPVAEGSCGDCHRIHGSEVSTLLAAEMPGVCNDCHDDVTLNHSSGQPAKNIHPPLEDDGCGACHGFHGANHNSLLTGPMPDLCHDCHDDPRISEYDEPWYFPHDPVAEGDCQECHNPHASNQTGLLVAPYNQVCYNCHGEEHEHPLELEIEYDKNIDLPPELNFTPRYEFYCSFCHGVHGSDEGSMLTGGRQELCPKCHTF